MRFLWWGALFVLLLVGTAWPAEFGASFAIDDLDTPQLLQELGATWVRSNLIWQQLEPLPGTYRWTIFDKQLAKAAAFRQQYPDVRVLITVRAKNYWAQQSIKGALPNATIPPVELSDYETFLTAVVTRARDVVDAWQIENEPESASWWAGTDEDYLALLRSAHDVIRREDPTALIAIGGFTSYYTIIAGMLYAGYPPADICPEIYPVPPGWVPPPNLQPSEGQQRALDFMETVLTEGAPYADIVDIHCYHRPWTIPLKLDWARAFVGDACELWITEAAGPDPQFYEYSEELQAIDLAERVSAAVLGGADAFFWFTLHETLGMPQIPEDWQQMGLVTQDGRKKPAYWAYRDAIESTNLIW